MTDHTTESLAANEYWLVERRGCKVGERRRCMLALLAETAKEAWKKRAELETALPALRPGCVIPGPRLTLEAVEVISWEPG